MAPDYSLTGEAGKRAVEAGLADAIWYTSPVPREEMRALLERKDGPAIRDTLIWFGLLGLSGYLGFALWGTGWAVLPFLVYGVIYASSSDARWHETSHGTAFKTDWMNVALYELASFMQVRESVVWRWSHTRHHTDTIIVGRDPEIAVQRPVDRLKFALSFFKIKSIRSEGKRMLIHASGRMSAEAATFVPESEWPKVYARARIYLAIYAGVIALAVYLQSWLPLIYVVLPPIYGTWLIKIYALTQHAGLAENVTDHRLNSRTVYMNPVNRFLYWNMNYHLEHHMFPLVPYHALPRLHALVKEDCPKPYNGLWEAWREILPAILRQAKDPSYFVQRERPAPTKQRDTTDILRSDAKLDEEGWIRVAETNRWSREEVLRFDHDGQTYAIYCASDGGFYTTDGICTHGNTHLAQGMVSGNIIECPKHNGRFDFRDGSVRRAPPCVALRTYPTEIRAGVIYVNLQWPGGKGLAEQTRYTFRVVSNENVSTFIKELVLEPLEDDRSFSYRPGEYIQLDIPAYEERTLCNVHVTDPYAKEWRDRKTHSLSAENAAPMRRNYSLASNPAQDRQLRFNIRLALPPEGTIERAGRGSSYIFQLQPGDIVHAAGPFGDFHIKQSAREMVYLGGGAGMAPLRSHLSHLLETQKTDRKISFWYGARSEQEMFYRKYFEDLAGRFGNFAFHYAYSEMVSSDRPPPHTGYIHDVLLKHYLSHHPAPAELEYYLCGPPAMMQAARGMLSRLDVPEAQISCDEF